jgi:haloalkane dehalogenase
VRLRSVPVDPTERLTEAVLDSTVNYENQGEGDPVVLLHGNPTSFYLWRSVIPELVDQARCLAPGGSTPTERPSPNDHIAGQRWPGRARSRLTARP